MRSRAVSLPFACCAWTRSGPPPSLARRRASSIWLTLARTNRPSGAWRLTLTRTESVVFGTGGRVIDAPRAAKIGPQLVLCVVKVGEREKRGRRGVRHPPWSPLRCGLPGEVLGPDALVGEGLGELALDGVL